MKDMESQSEMLNYGELWKEGNVKKWWAEDVALSRAKKGIV